MSRFTEQAENTTLGKSTAPVALNELLKKKSSLGTPTNQVLYSDRLTREIANYKPPTQRNSGILITLADSTNGVIPGEPNVPPVEVQTLSINVIDSLLINSTDEFII